MQHNLEFARLNNKRANRVGNIAKIFAYLEGVMGGHNSQLDKFANQSHKAPKLYFQTKKIMF